VWAGYFGLSSFATAAPVLIAKIQVFVEDAPPIRIFGKNLKARNLVEHVVFGHPRQGFQP